MRSRWWIEKCGSYFLLIHQKHIYMGNNFIEYLLNVGRSHTIRTARKINHEAGQDERKRKKKGIKMGPAPLGESCERTKHPSLWESLLLAGRSARAEREASSEPHRSVQQACGRYNKERPIQMVLATMLHFPSLRHAFAAAHRDQVLKQASVDRPGERTGCLSGDDGVWSGP